MSLDVLVVRKILVGTEGLPDDETALLTLGSLLGPDRAVLRIVHVITVPMTVPLEASMPEAEARAEAVLARASELAARLRVPVETAVLRGRSVGEALVEEARRAEASAVCVRLRSRPAPMGHYLVSATVSTLLHASPCPVIVFHLPHPRGAHGLP